MREYSYNEKSMILETKTTGILKIVDIISHYEKITLDDSLPRNLKELIDCRGTQFDLNLDEIKLAINAVKNAILKYNYIRESIIVDEPFETAVAIFFENISTGIKSYNFKVFDTEYGARNWIF